MGTVPYTHTQIHTHPYKNNNPKPYESVSRSLMFDSLQPHGLQSTRLFCPWDSPGKNIGVGCHSLLQGNLPDSGIKPRSPALQAILYGLSHQTLNQAPKPYEVVSLIIFILQMNKPRSKEVMHNLCSQLTGCSPARKWYH